MDWEVVATGCTDTEVRRSGDGRAFSKTARDLRWRAELAGERDRTAWLTTTGIPGPRVLDWLETEDGATLVTSAVPGVPAGVLGPADVAAAAPRLAAALADLHGVPARSCPFDRSLDVTVRHAERHARLGLVDESALDPDAPADLVARLQETRPREEELVVCHGDATLPNVLLDPDSLRVTGWVDLGRLGLADRHQDLALATRSMRAAPAAADVLLAAYPVAADPDRLAFYRLLDEFF